MLSKKIEMFAPLGLLEDLYIYIYILGLGKRFECSNLRSFAAHSNLNFSFRSFAATPTLLFAHAHLHSLNMWVCSRNVEVVLLAASVSFLSPALLNPSRNNDRRPLLVIKHKSSFGGIL